MGMRKEGYKREREETNERGDEEIPIGCKQEGFSGAAWVGVSPPGGMRPLEAGLRGVGEASAIRLRGGGYRRRDDWDWLSLSDV